MTTTAPDPLAILGTLTPAQFTRLNDARRLQIERYRTAFYKKEGQLPSASDTGISPTWLRVIAGGRDCSIPIKLLSDWAATFGRDEGAAIKISLKAHGSLTLQRLNSTLRVYTVETHIDEKGNAWRSPNDAPRYGHQSNPLDPAISITEASHGVLSVVIPEEQGGAGANDELTTLKAQTTAIRKALTREKAIAKAKSGERQALANLTKATEEAAEAQTILDGKTLKQAIAFARRCLAARRFIRDALTSPDIQPPWLPPTYEDDNYHYDESLGHSKRSVKVMDTVSVWHDRVNAFASARAARQAYKPRRSWMGDYAYRDDANAEGLSIAAYKKAHPELGTPIYGPAFDKLAGGEKAALRDLTDFLEERFAQHCDTVGLPGKAIASTRYQWDYLSECRAWSRARVLLRSWPQRRNDLADVHREAMTARKNAEEA